MDCGRKKVALKKVRRRILDNQLRDLMADLKEQETLALAQELIAAGTDPLDVLAAAREAMEIVGRRFETYEYFIPDLVMAGEILAAISGIIKPLLTSGETNKKKGKVLIGTVEGDIHDIGKDLVTFMLDVNGYEVLDIGVDVPVQVFVEKIKDFQPQVVGLSAFLTLAFESMKKTIVAL
jgi:trimethylamine corrinoid protein